MQRTTILLPDDHPLLRHPKGSRSKIAQEWMERGIYVSWELENIKKELNKITGELESLRQDVREVKEGGIVAVKESEDKDNTDNRLSEVLDEFLDI